MTMRRSALVLRHARRLVAGEGVGQHSDARLLERFAARRDEAAFEALVRRHGPMVLRVCQRVLRDRHAAEDAFQATFMVLLRRARDIGRGASLAGWLHGVAYRVALRARTDRARRRVCEARATRGDRADPPAELSGRELCAVLDFELDRLADRYRAPLLLCYAEGRTRDEAARQLGWSLGTLKRRLEQGRALLKSRLGGRGVTLSGALLAAALGSEAPSAARESELVRATARAALSFLADPLPAAAANSPQIVGLTEGVLRAMFMTKVKRIVATLAVAGILAAGSTLAALKVLTAQEPAGKPAEGARPAAPKNTPGSEGGQPAGAADEPLPEGAAVRLGGLSFRVGDQVHALALSPDGNTLASADPRGIRLWDARSGVELRRWDSEGPYSSIAFSSRGTSLVIASSRSGTMLCRDVATGQILYQFVGHAGPVHAIALSPDGQYLASAGGDGTVRLWEMAGTRKSAQPAATTPPLGAAPNFTRLGETRRFEGHDGAVRAVAFSHDGKVLISGGSDRTVRLWDAAGGRNRLTLKGHDNEVLSVAGSPSGGLVASSSSDQTVRLWDAESGASLHTLRARARPEADALKILPGLPIAFSPDGKALALGGWGPDGAIEQWDVARGTGRAPLLGHAGPISGLVYSADGKSLITGSYDATIRQWDLAAGKERSLSERHDGPVTAVAFSPDGKKVATGSEDRTIRLWDAASGKAISRLAGRPGEFVHAVAFSPDGTRLAGAYDRTVRVWDVLSGREVVALKGHRIWISALAFSADGKTLATASGDETVRLWDAQTGRGIREMRVPKNIVWWSLALSPDGKTVAAGGQDYDAVGCLRMWDAATGAERAFLGDPHVHARALAFSPDGRMLAAASDGHAVRVWETATGKSVRQFGIAGYPPHPFPFPIAFSRDGRSLAAGCLDGKVRVWELATGGERCQFQGHRGGIKAIDFAPDGGSLVTGSADSTALVWDLSGRHGAARAGGPLTAADAERLSVDLRDSDPAKAYRAIQLLSNAPGQALPVLKACLPVTKPADAEALDSWIRDLDSKTFAARGTAAAGLSKLGDAAEPALRQALRAPASAETRKRLENLLDQLLGDRLPRARALEALERIGTAQARQVVEDLARGIPGVWLTEEARAAEKRMSTKESSAR